MGDRGELIGAHPELLSAGFRIALQKVAADRKISARDFQALAQAVQSAQDRDYLNALTARVSQTPDNVMVSVPVKIKPGGPPEAVTVDFSSDVTDKAAETLVLDYKYSGRSPREVARLLKALVSGYTTQTEEKAIAGLLNDHLDHLTELVRALSGEGLTLKQVASEVSLSIEGPRLFAILPTTLHADTRTIADAVLERLTESTPAQRQAFYRALDPESLEWLRQRAKGQLP